MKENFFINRHSFRSDKKDPESKNYPGLSAKKGVEAAKKHGEEQDRELVEKAPEGALIFLSGATESPRTASTLELRGDGLKVAFGENDQVLVLTKKEVDDILETEKSVSRGVEKLVQIINDNKNKKIVVDFPMFINELSFGRHWDFFPRGKEASYFNYLMNKYNDDEDKCFNEWIKTKGRSEHQAITGPDPEIVAQEYLDGLRRLKKFVNQYIQGRPFIIGANAHRWELDAFILKMAGGKIDQETFQKIAQNRLTDENEGAYLEIDGKKITLNYREKEYERTLD